MEKGIIEKLGISEGPWKWVDKGYCEIIEDSNNEIVIDDGSAWGEYAGCISMVDCNAQLIATAPEILEALINICNQEELATGNTYYEAVDIIEKATNKSWEDIKGLL